MKPVSRILAVTTIVFSLLCFSCSVAEAQRRPPNILVIVTDDMGYGDIGIHGSKDIPYAKHRCVGQSWNPLHRRVCQRPVLQSH